jgi:uncharacterized protein YjiS (DUF1127 family)
MKSHCAETEVGIWPTAARADFARGKVGTGTDTNFSRPGMTERNVGMLRLWRARARARAADRRVLAELSALDAHTLRDIGINWAYLHWQASKPFWRA